MPAVYAHHSFGVKVFRSLPREMRALVLEHRREYEIGLQGPDILFFYRFWEKDAVNSVGYDLHEQTAASFMERARAALRAEGLRTDSAPAAYLYGFLCHFMLDSSCHPFVSESMEKTGKGHIYIESEFEKHMLTADGREPMAAPIWRLISKNIVPGQELARFYPGVTPAQITAAQKYMALVKRVLYAPDEKSLARLKGLMGRVGMSAEFYEHLLTPGFDPACTEAREGLEARLLAAVEETADRVVQLKELLETDRPFPQRFERNFE